MFIYLDLVFEAFGQNMWLSFHSDTFAGIRDFFKTLTTKLCKWNEELKFS